MKKEMCLLAAVLIFGGCADLGLYGDRSNRSSQNIPVEEEKVLTPEEQRAQKLQEDKQKLEPKYNRLCELFGSHQSVNENLSSTQFISDLATALKAEGIETTGVATNNVVFHNIAYTSLREQANRIQQLLSMAEPYFGQDECYKNLSLQVKTMQKMQNELCKKAWKIEEARFKKQIGYSMPRRDDDMFNSNPKQGILYSFRGRIMQNIQGGILIDDGGHKTRFLYTPYTYPDDEYLEGVATFAGMFQYITTLGASKTVYAFRQFPKNKYTQAVDKVLFYKREYQDECEPNREPTPAEIKKSFKKVTDPFVQVWGTERPDSVYRGDVDEYYATHRNKSERGKVTGILFNSNKLFWQRNP